jgi:hypothetical protein
MGNIITTNNNNNKNINFEDMQIAIKESISENNIKEKKILIINTLLETNQRCLIKGTLPYNIEEEVINHQLKKNKSISIIIYGMNSADYSIFKKYDQLIKLGFYNIFIYTGGLFEWLLLQDIYNCELFPTTTKENDILKYKGIRQFNIKLLSYN